MRRLASAHMPAMSHGHLGSTPSHGATWQVWQVRQAMSHGHLGSTPSHVATITWAAHRHGPLYAKLSTHAVATAAQLTTPQLQHICICLPQAAANHVAHASSTQEPLAQPRSASLCGCKAPRPRCRADGAMCGTMGLMTSHHIAPGQGAEQRALHSRGSTASQTLAGGRDNLQAAQERPQRLRHHHAAVLLLVVLQNGHQHARHRARRGVEGVHVVGAAAAGRLVGGLAVGGGRGLR